MVAARAALRVIPANEYRRERWKNGQGWTREIARDREDEDWGWRLSIAEIEQDSDFSRFPGIDRELVLLTGNELRLRFGDGESIELQPPYASARFAGERAVRGELVAGRTTDFNLMWRRARIDAQLWRRPLVGAMVIFVDPGETWVVHLLSGQARFADEANAQVLEAGDTALLHARDGRARGVLDGAGEALVIRLASKPKVA